MTGQEVPTGWAALPVIGQALVHAAVQLAPFVLVLCVLIGIGLVLITGGGRDDDA